MRSSSARLTSTKEIPRFPASRTDFGDPLVGLDPNGHVQRGHGHLGSATPQPPHCGPPPTPARVRSSRPAPVPRRVPCLEKRTRQSPSGSRRDGRCGPLRAGSAPVRATSLGPAPDPHRRALHPDCADSSLPAPNCRPRQLHPFKVQPQASGVSSTTSTSGGEADPGCYRPRRRSRCRDRAIRAACKAAGRNFRLASTVGVHGTVDSVRCQSSGVECRALGKGHSKHRARVRRSQRPSSRQIGRPSAILPSRTAVWINAVSARGIARGHRPWRPRTRGGNGRGCGSAPTCSTARSTKFSIRE